MRRILESLTIGFTARMRQFIGGRGLAAGLGEGGGMRVLVLTQQFPNREQPYLAPFLRSQVVHLSKLLSLKVVAPVLWCPGSAWVLPSAKLRLSVPEVEMLSGLEIEHPRVLYCPRSGQVLDAALYAMSLYRRLDPADFDLILAFWAYPDGVAAAILGRLWSKPVVIQAMGSDLNGLDSRPLVRSQVRWAFARVARVLTVSSGLAQLAREVGSPRVAVVPRGVDGDIFVPMDPIGARQTLGLRLDRRYVLFVGRLEKIKGISELLVALGGLPEDCTLLIVGDGSLKSACELLQKRDPQRVIVAGSRAQSELPLWYGAADLIALPSHSEGTPNVLREALSCGRPVVATEVGGIPELLVSPIQGRMVPPRDGSALRDALLEVLNRVYRANQIRQISSLPSWTESSKLLCEQLYLTLRRG